MSDLELTKLCAEAMGYTLENVRDSGVWRIRDEHGDVVGGLGDAWKYLHQYDPLHDDAQCFALVKRFKLEVAFTIMDVWLVTNETEAETGEVYHYNNGSDVDLNRAICKCVANMQQAK